MIASRIVKQLLDTSDPAAPPALSRRARLTGVLRNRDLRLIIGGRTVSVLGDQIAVVAIIMYAYTAGLGTTGVAAVMVASTLPLAFGAPLAGALVDRVPSRVLTIGAAVWEGASVLGLALIVRFTHPSQVTMAGMLFLLFALGAGQAVSGPAWTALVPTVCARQDVGPAVGTVQASTTLASVLGPALGGVIVAGAGTATALAVDAATFVALILAAMAVRGVRTPQPQPTGGSGLWAGFRVIGGDAVIRALVSGVVLLLLCLHVIMVLQVFLVTDVLGGDTRAYGAMGAAFAAGMVAGALVGGQIDGTSRRFRTVVACFGAVPVGVLLAGFAPSLLAFGAAMFVVGLTNGTLTVCLNAILLTRVADAVRGRVLAAFIGAVQTCNLIGMVVGGPLGKIAGPRAVFVGAGAAGLLVCAAVAMATKRMLITGVPDAPLAFGTKTP